MRIKAVTPAQQAGGQAVAALQKARRTLIPSLRRRGMGWFYTHYELVFGFQDPISPEL